MTKIINEDILTENEEGLLDKDLAKDSLLNARQELFCQLYATHEEFFGNGTQAYIEAYNPDREGNWYKSAQASASRLLSNVKIIERINTILEQTGFNEAFVDKQLSFLIAQHDDKSVKLGAIKEFNALKARIIKKLDLTTNGKDIGGLESKTDEQLDAIIAETERRKSDTAGPRSDGPDGPGRNGGESQKDPSTQTPAQVHPVPVPGV